jgi:hypothetical protein
VRDSAEDAEVTRLLRERDRIDARLGELGVKMPARPGGVTLAEWPDETAAAAPVGEVRFVEEVTLDPGYTPPWSGAGVCGHEPEGRELALDPAFDIDISGIGVGDWITYRSIYPELPDYRAQVVRLEARNRGLVVVDEQPGMPLEHLVTWDRVVGKVK